MMLMFIKIMVFKEHMSVNKLFFSLTSLSSISLLYIDNIYVLLNLRYLC